MSGWFESLQHPFTWLRLSAKLHKALILSQCWSILVLGTLRLPMLVSAQKREFFAEF
jgi:hypothetical protein